MPRCRARSETRARAARRAAGALLVAIAVAGCAGGPGTAARYDDPFSYCAAVGTADVPAAPYAGPAMPTVIPEGLRRAFGAPADAPLEVFARGASWRCMNGQVYACSVGANLPCAARADTSREASGALIDFCKREPGAAIVPMVVTGRATVYEWRCARGAPVIVRQVVEPDARGFLSNIWFAIPRP